MNPLRERARAKVNLTLDVLGKRADGCHELVSLVAFARKCDHLALAPVEETSLNVEGPFAASVSATDNLILKAADLLAELCPDIRAGVFTLDKHLPVAAGLGGGSADAAAALRLIERANAGAIAPEVIRAAAGRLGADVSVCVESRAALMRGRGDDLTPVRKLPTLSVVLVNPGVALGAKQVYSALDAPPLGDAATEGDFDQKLFRSTEDLVQHIRERGNDLESAATTLAPVIADVRAALAATDGCLVVQMSGSGPTCFGVYGDSDAAAAAAQRLADLHPQWWAVETEIR